MGLDWWNHVSSDRRVSLVVLSMLALIASSCSGTDDAAPAIGSEETTTTSVETTPPIASEPNETEVARLWDQLLSVFESSAKAREQVAAGLPDQLPVEEALRLSELYFVTGEPLDLTSNAIYSPQANGSFEIVDCADSSGPSVLGPTTAGFTAMAELSQAGDMTITELKAVPRCVQRGPGQAAIDNYQLFLQAVDDLWSDPRIDHPSIDQYRTERAAEDMRAYLSELEERDLLHDTIVNREAVQRGFEIVGYQPDEITLRVCEHGDDTVGIFNAAGERTDLFGPPWRVELSVRMRKVGGEWLFDELINRVEGDCLMGTSQFGLQLL